MAYNDDLTWDDVANKAGSRGNDLISALLQGQREYDEWQSFRAGRTNAQIATALSRTETEVAELDSCYSAFKALNDYANNQTPSQSDYYFSMRKFT